MKLLISAILQTNPDISSKFESTFYNIDGYIFNLKNIKSF